MDEMESLQKRLRQMMNDLADTVSTGGCKNFEHYQKLCGMIEGLALAERELLDVRSKQQED